MNVLWLTWKDRRHPHAGGAETVNEELAARLAADGHEVTFLVGGFPGCESEESREGYRIVRLGGRYSVYLAAFVYYRRHLSARRFDIVIDEMNTIPFFAKYYVQAENNILLSYQLCREIWFYQMPFPLNVIGYLIEPVYLWFLRDRTILTESESTKRDLMRYGFKAENISVFSVGLHMDSDVGLELGEKFERFTVLSLGSVREMKRTMHVVKAFEEAKRHVPKLKLIVAGDIGSSYGRRVCRYVEKSSFREDISVLGRVDDAVKRELMRKSHVICVTSLKEGWGLIVTEAAVQGTPAIVYDVDGLRDTVGMGEAGVLCERNTPSDLAEQIVGMATDTVSYAETRFRAYRFSRRFSLDYSYESFRRALRRHDIMV